MISFSRFYLPVPISRKAQYYHSKAPTAPCPRSHHQAGSFLLSPERLDPRPATPLPDRRPLRCLMVHRSGGLRRQERKIYGLVTVSLTNCAVAAAALALTPNSPRWILSSSYNFFSPLILWTSVFVNDTIFCYFKTSRYLPYFLS